jgi:chemotaxis protein MotA
MRFYLSVIIVLLTISVGMFFGGISVGVVFNISEWILITGIATGSFIMSNPSAFFKQLSKQLPKVMSDKPYKKADYLDLLAFMFNFFKYSNSVNVTELESQIDNPYNSNIFNKHPVLLKNKEALSFFQNHFRLLTLGFQDIYEIENMMEADLETRRNYASKVTKALNKLGDSLPALGIVAAVLGVIGAMASAGSAPEILGARVAGALIGTFAGVFFAYCVVNPICSFLDRFQNDELDFIECMKTGMLSYMKGHPTSISVEFARQVIAEDVQPTFNEVEAIIYNSK